MNFLEAWDIGARDGMQLLHHAWLTPVIRFISALGSLEVVRLVAILSMLFFIFIGRWRTGLCLVAAILLAYGIEQTAKPWVNRSRPDVKWVEAKDKPKSPSFPSGHAILSMAVYGGLALSLAARMETRKLKVLLVAAGLFLPLLIGFTRLYLGYHYMSDVVGGLSAGLGCVLLFRWIDLKWSAIDQRKNVTSTTATAPVPKQPSPKSLEPIQHSGGEQIQA
jgi:membrane-associated phospholipid phosphatase